MPEPTEGASPPRLLKIPEVAGRLGASRSYVYQLIRRGELGCVELPVNTGARWSGKRVKESELEDFISRNEQPATAKAQ